MADRHDELEARRWFRQRLADLAQQHPQLTMPAGQARLDAALDTLTEEDTTHGENTNRPTEGQTEGDRETR